MTSTNAFAKATAEVYLPLQTVYTASMRFVRVDRGCSITEKDGDAAFVIFECPLPDAKRTRGSFELIRGKDERAPVRIQVTLSDEPHYMESRWVELFEKKLRDDYGASIGDKPPALAPPAPPAKKPERDRDDKNDNATKTEKPGEGQ